MLSVYEIVYVILSLWLKKPVFQAIVKNTYLTRRPSTCVLTNVYGGFVFKKNLPPWAVQFPPFVLKSSNEHALSRRTEMAGIWGADLPTVLSVVAAAAAKVGTSERPFFCPTHLSAFQKCRIKGGRNILDNQKYFGNISEKQPFSEIISHLFFWGSATIPVAVRRVSRRTSGQKCVWRDARHRARDARAPNSNQSKSVKLGQTDSAGQADGQIVCKGFNMNDLRNKQRLGGSNSVKVGQTSSGEGRPTGIRPFFASFSLGDFAFNSDTENQTKSRRSRSQSVAVICRTESLRFKVFGPSSICWVCQIRQTRC